MLVFFRFNTTWTIVSPLLSWFPQTGLIVLQPRTEATDHMWEHPASALPSASLPHLTSHTRLFISHYGTTQHVLQVMNTSLDTCYGGSPCGESLLEAVRCVDKSCVFPTSRSPFSWCCILGNFLEVLLSYWKSLIHKVATLCQCFDSFVTLLHFPFRLVSQWLRLLLKHWQRNMFACSAFWESHMKIVFFFNKLINKANIDLFLP